MEKTIEIEGIRVIVKTMSIQTYWDIAELEKRTKDTLASSKAMMLHSIVSWNVVDDKGNPAPVTIENIGKYLGLNFLTKIDKAMVEVNDLSEEEKKTSLKQSAPESTTETGASGTI